MKYELTTDSESTRLILIFAGWGTDASFYSHISVPGYDTMVVWDYSDLSFPTEILSRYTTVALFAWSLGVFAASAVLPFDKLAFAIAVNGTEYPVSDTCGIPESIFTGTSDTLDERNLLKFRRRMTGKNFESLKNRFPEIPIENLKEQLRNIHALCRQHKASGKWTKVFVSENDAIFPVANQLEAWSHHPSHPEVVITDNYHYLDLNDVVQGAVPAQKKVGERFRKALSTYDDQASAQKEIAKDLLRLIPDCKADNVIEVGPGSGVFTYLFAKRFSPERIEYIDLYTLPHYEAAAIEKYHTADAEEWFENKSQVNADGYDIIVSASAMQWFINPKRFFRNAATLLHKNGIIAFSGFLPGNLEELMKVNPFGLTYRSCEQLMEMLTPYFENITIKEKSYQLEFNSPVDLLRHIKNTGVGGSSVSGLPLHELISRLPKKLTYRPVFIIARKKS